MEYKDSAAAADVKSAKVFAVIAIAGFLVLNFGAYFISTAPLSVVHNTPALWAVPVIAALWSAVCVYAVLKDAFWITQAKWPYYLLIALSFASAFCLGYNPGA